MKTGLALFFLAASLLCAAPGSVLAQSKPKAPAGPTTKPTAKPAAKPAPSPKTTAKPAPKPAAAPAPAARPASAPSPAPAAPPRARRTGPFEVGTNALNLGIGLGSRYGYGAGFFGGSSSVSPAFSLSYERGFRELGPGVLGLGVFGGYQGASYDLGGGDKIKYNDVILTLRGAWHYPVTPQFDAYGGLGLGLRHSGVSYEGPHFAEYGASSSTELASGLFVGGRYFFTESIGVFGEVGYDQTFLKAGLSAKF